MRRWLKVASGSSKGAGCRGLGRREKIADRKVRFDAERLGVASRNLDFAAKRGGIVHEGRKRAK